MYEKIYKSSGPNRGIAPKLHQSKIYRRRLFCKVKRIKPGRPFPPLQSYEEPIIQASISTDLSCITQENQIKARGLNLEDNLGNAISMNVDVDLINDVFKFVSNTKLNDLPENGLGIWEEYIKAKNFLGDEHFRKWLELVGAAVVDIPEFRMLLTGVDLKKADDLATEILEASGPPPPMYGKSYISIVDTLEKLGYVQMESYEDTENDRPAYGQDVWCNDENMVIRIKVGGRCLSGRYPRPPHVVKEITKDPYGYSPSDIICKLTDDGLKIPAGTKYSAKDMQSWYVKNTGKKLENNAWKNPGSSGDQYFAALHQMWAEGAHTEIGLVPAVPLVKPSEVDAYRSTYERLNNKIVVGRMEKYGIDASITEDNPKNYLSLDEYLLWADAKEKLGIK